MGCENSTCKNSSNVAPDGSNAQELNLQRQSLSTKENALTSAKAHSTKSRAHSSSKSLTEEIFSSEEKSMTQRNSDYDSLSMATKTETYMQYYKEQALNNLRDQALKELRIGTLSDIEKTKVPTTTK